MRGSKTLVVCVALAVQGCAVGAGCTDVGGFDGVGVEIPRASFVSSGNVLFEVCDGDDCASASQRLGRVPQGPVGRGASVTFDDLGQRFGPGSVTLKVEVADSRGNVLAAARRKVGLTRSYPNGKSCDGDGYVNGTLTLTPADRI
jgi:hypothetical protein